MIIPYFRHFTFDFQLLLYIFFLFCVAMFNIYETPVSDESRVHRDTKSIDERIGVELLSKLSSVFVVVYIK